MITDFVITFRETLEAALIVGIILSYLQKTKRTEYNNIVYLGIFSALIASVIGAILFNYLVGGFVGVAEQIFEGVVMILGSVLITFMILWMLQQKHIALDLHKKIDKQIDQVHLAGLFFVVFISVFREGIETVLFLGAASFTAGGTSLVGALAGVIGAIILGYFIFVVGKKVNLKIFFNITSILLVLFAAGLFAHGIHELQEASIIPIVVEHVWDVNYLLNENGTIGSLAKGLFGYNGNPSLIEVLAYLAYLGIILVIYLKVGRK